VALSSLKPQILCIHAHLTSMQKSNHILYTRGYSLQITNCIKLQVSLLQVHGERCLIHHICRRENLGRWFNKTNGSVAAHEFGHLLGKKDEYQPADPNECPIRNSVNTGTIMDHNSRCFPDRLMTQFATAIDSQIVQIPDYTHNPTQCT
jgi:hypothetical protein